MPNVKYVGPYHFRVFLRSELSAEGLPEGTEDEPLVWGRTEGTVIELSDDEFEQLKRHVNSGEFVVIDESSSSEESSESVSDQPEEVENASSE